MRHHDSTAVCAICGASFQSINYKRPEGDPFRVKLYCSRKCYGVARRKAQDEFRQTTKPCEQCGKPFGPGKGRRSHIEFENRRFCSSECTGLSQQNDIQKLLERVEVNPATGCHIWTGWREKYGRVKIAGRNSTVHRVIWEHFKGPVPDGLQLDHMCAARLCCNVDHLRLVTARENILAATCNNMAARHHRRVKCPLCGGPYSVMPNGVRFCPPCRHRQKMNYQKVYRAQKRKQDNSQQGELEL